MSKIEANTKKIKNKEPGQLLVEVIISIGLIAILVAGILPLVLSSANAVNSQTKAATGSLLAKEGIDAAKAIKDESWNSIYFPLNTSNKGPTNLYHPLVSSSKWQLATGDENVTLNGITFQRSLIIENVSRSGANGTGDIVTVAGWDDPSTQKITVRVSWLNTNPITISEYVTRFSSQVVTDTDWSAGQYSTINNLDADTTVGALQLAKVGVPQVGQYGNKSLLTSTNGIGHLNNTTKKSSMRFTAQKTGTVTTLRIYIDAQNNSGATTYRYGFQFDVSGLPSGTYLGSGTAAFAATGWQTVTLSAPLSITSGTIYHLVVGYDSGTVPNGSRYVDLRDSLPLNNLIPVNQTADLNQNVLFFSGSWSLSSRQPLYVLEYNDSTFEGNAYDTSAERQIYGVNFEGELFTPVQDTKISALSLYVRKNTNPNPAGSLMVAIRDITTSTDFLASTVFTTGAALTTSYQWVTLSIPSNPTLTATHRYRLIFSSPGSVVARRYEVYNTSNPNTADFNGIGWDGLSSIASRSVNSGGAWTDLNNVDLSGYYFATVIDPFYALSGDLTSQTIDLTDRAGLNRLFWTNSALPAGTTVTFQMAANNDNATWNYLGPDGTAGSFYTAFAGENIASILSNNRYARYKVLMTTNNNTITPVLADVTINYSL